jgi:anaerobic selenocysteine-containing dehydrogenase
VGTDAALALAMAHVMVNELAVFDAPYLQAKTNAPYLIGPGGRYVRDATSGKPLVWDLATHSARPFSDARAADMALEGSFEVDGVNCRPAFALLREHLRKFTPEWSESLCTVPAANIRRLAGEFAREARIGSTIVVDGLTLPYRPVAAIAFRGAQGHVNSVYNFFAIDLLNQLVGAADVVGSCLGFAPASLGYPGTGRPRYVPSPDPDGLMRVGTWMGYHYPYPPSEPRMPQKMGLQDLFVMGMTSPFLDSVDREAFWEKLELPYRPEVLINFGSNLLLSIANRRTVADSLAKYKFMVSFDLYLTETSSFADIVLPDCSYLQSWDSRSMFPFILAHPAGMGEWSWPIRQPVLPPEGEQRRFNDVLMDLADRIGMRADLNAALNASLDLKPPYRLDSERRYSYEEICDIDLKCNFGPEHGLEWFKQNGVLTWPKKPEEVYWRPFVDVRVPVYWEFLLDVGEKIAALAEPRGVEIDRQFYQPLPDFIPCRSHCCSVEGFDLYAFYYRDTLHTNSYTLENPWLDEAAKIDPNTYAIAINAATGRQKGLRDGQEVLLQTERGREVKGRVRLTEAVHPEGVGIAACAGHWGEGMPIAKDKGVAFNALLELDWQHVSPINLNLDLCVRVKVVPV